MKVEHKYPLLRCELYIASSCQRIKFRKGGKQSKFIVEKLDCLSQVIKVHIKSIIMFIVRLACMM